MKRLLTVLILLVTVTGYTESLQSLCMSSLELLKHCRLVGIKSDHSAITCRLSKEYIISEGKNLDYKGRKFVAELAKYCEFVCVNNDPISSGFLINYKDNVCDALD